MFMTVIQVMIKNENITALHVKISLVNYICNVSI